MYIRWSSVSLFYAEIPSCRNRILVIKLDNNDHSNKSNSNDDENDDNNDNKNNDYNNNNNSDNNMTMKFKNKQNPNKNIRKQPNLCLGQEITLLQKN